MYFKRNQRVDFHLQYPQSRLHSTLHCAGLCPKGWRSDFARRGAPGSGRGVASRSARRRRAGAAHLGPCRAAGPGPGLGPGLFFCLCQQPTNGIYHLFAFRLEALV